MMIFKVPFHTLRGGFISCILDCRKISYFSIGYVYILWRAVTGWSWRMLSQLRAILDMMTPPLHVGCSNTGAGSVQDWAQVHHRKSFLPLAIQLYNPSLWLMHLFTLIIFVWLHFITPHGTVIKSISTGINKVYWVWFRTKLNWV